MKVHSKESCVDGLPCPFHNPTDHPMREWKMALRASGLVERECEHGIGHPDPDSIAFLEVHGGSGQRGSWGLHGCDGCCAADS